MKAHAAGLIAVILVGCSGKPTTDWTCAKPQGTGALVKGVVVHVEANGDILTNIPVRWVAASPDDSRPFEGQELVPPEYLPLKLGIGGKECRAAFGCNRGGFRQAEWGLLWGPGDKLVLICAEMNAAKVAGVSEGVEVRLAKTDETEEP
jgi:hypothetical protein